MRLILPIILLLALSARANAAPSSATLALGVVQLALEPTLAGNRDKIIRFIGEAAVKDCRVVVFPESALLPEPKTPKADIDTAIAAIQEAARAHSIYTIFCAIYIGRPEALWSEIAELAAVRGAQMHFHLCNDADATTGGALLRRQLWANLASFRTFTATVNATGGSALWEDFRRNRKGTSTGYGRYCAVELATAGAGDEIIYAQQTVAKSNPHFGSMIGKTNPQMKDWYEMGARVIDADGSTPEPRE